jgi:hypothetical protein
MKQIWLSWIQTRISILTVNLELSFFISYYQYRLHSAKYFSNIRAWIWILFYTEAWIRIQIYTEAWIRILIYTETNDILTNRHLNEGATNMFYFPNLVFYRLRTHCFTCRATRHSLIGPITIGLPLPCSFRDCVCMWMVRALILLACTEQTLPLIGCTALAEQRRKRPIFALSSRSTSALLPCIRYERNFLH